MERGISTDQSQQSQQQIAALVRDMHGARTVHETMQIVARHLIDMVHADRCSITVLTEDRRHLELFALTGVADAIPMSHMVPVDGTAVGWCVRQQTQRLEPDTSTDLAHADSKMLASSGLLSFVDSPLSWNGACQGTLNVAYRARKGYSDEILAYLSQIADVVSVFLESRILIEREEQARRDAEENSRRLHSLTELAQLLGLPSDKREVTQLLSAFLNRILPMDRFSIALCDGDKFWVWTTGQYGPANTPASGVFQKVLADREAELIDAVDGEESWDPDQVIGGRWRSAVVVPITVGGAAIGTVNVASRTPGCYDARDVRLLESVGFFVGSTLQNFRSLRSSEAAERRARLANRAKSEFLANMSHELRTPMNGVLGTCELMLHSDLPVEHREAVETIDRSSRALLSLLNDILDLSKVEAGALELEAQVFDLHETIDEAFEVIVPQARGKGIHLAACPDPGMPRQVRGDPHRIRQILINLLGNAVKFTQTGAVVLSVRGRGRCVDFRVLDTGPGIPAEKLATLAEPFTQADCSTTREFGGTGLGLTIAKRLSEAMGGGLRIRSRVGSGSLFVSRLELPGVGVSKTSENQSVCVDVEDPVLADLLARQVQALGAQCVLTGESIRLVSAGRASGQPHEVLVGAQRQVSGEGAQVLVLPATLRRIEAHLRPSTRPEVSAPRPSESLPSFRGIGLSVLVAEDNAVNQQVIEKMLDRLGLRCVIVENGLEAVAVVRERHFDVVLMDLQMPVMDGFDAAARIRELDQPQPHLIALTANALVGDRARCLEQGMDDYISKPVSLGSLADGFRRYVARMAAEGGAAGATGAPDSPPREPGRRDD